MINMIRGFLANPQDFLQKMLPTSRLQQNLGNTFSQLLGGNAPTRQTNLAGGTIADLLSATPGANVLSAAQPIFQENLDRSMAEIKSGRPFSSATGVLQGDYARKAQQDFNLFSQGAIESDMNRQGQLAMGILGGGTQFAGVQNQQQGLQAGLFELLAGLGGQGAGLGQQTFVQKPGFFSQLVGALSSLGSAALPFLGGGGGGGANVGALMNPTMTSFSAPQFGGPMSGRTFTRGGG